MKKSQVRRIDPEFPKWETPKSGAGFIFGILLWIVMFIVFLVMAYSVFFAIKLVYLMKLVKDRNYQVPIWFSVLCTIFLFPATLLVIIVATLIKIIREAR